MAKTNDRVHLNQRDRLLILGFWILFGLLETTGTYVAAKGTDAPLPFDTAVLANMPFWLVWGMLTPVAFWIAWRFRFQEGKQVRFALVHFPFALLLSAIQIMIAGGIYWYATRSARTTCWTTTVGFASASSTPPGSRRRPRSWSRASPRRGWRLSAWS